MSYYQKMYDELIAHRRKYPINKSATNVGEIEYHHIVPISCGGNNDRRIPENNHEGTNIVGLTCREHFVAHWLLVRIYQHTNFYYKMLHAFSMMCITRNGKIKISSVAYAEAKRRISLVPMKPTVEGKILVNDGIKQWFVFPDQVPAGVKLGKIKCARTGKITVHKGRKIYYVDKDKIPEDCEIGMPKGRIFVTDGKIDCIVFSDEIPEGFHPGKTGKPNQDKVYVNNGLIDKLVYPDQIPEGFKIGRLYNTSTKNKIRVSNGIVEKFVYPDQIEPGYKIGGLTKGKKIVVNDGKRNIRVFPDQIPDGFVIGDIQKINKGRIWVNNGIKQKIVYPDQIPEGYVKGGLKKVSKNEKH